MNITKKIKIDLAQRGADPVIDAVRGEQESRKIIFELYDNGQKFEQEITSVNISFETQQKTGGTYNALEDGTEAFSVNGNEVEITIARQVTAVEGRTKIVVSLFGDIDTKLCTFPCVVDVAPNPELDNLNPQNYYNIIDLLNSVITAGEGIKIEDGVISVTNVTGGGSVEVQGVSGENYIEDLPLGLSYAAEDTQLKYLSNAEEIIYSTLSVATGSCIIKTLGQIADSGIDEMFDGAITIYVIPRDHVWNDEYGHQGDLLMKKITPFHDMYGLQYSSEEIKNDVTVVSEIIDEGFDDPIQAKEVPSVRAVINYVASILPTDVSEVGM